MAVLVSVDTNLFIYAFNGDAKFGRAARELLRSLNANNRIIVSSLVLTEMLHGAKANAEVVAHIEGYLDAFTAMDMVAADVAIARKAGLLLGENKSLRIGDAIHLATAALSGAHEFWTNDAKLTKLAAPGLKVRLLTDLVA